MDVTCTVKISVFFYSQSSVKKLQLASKNFNFSPTFFSIFYKPLYFFLYIFSVDFMLFYILLGCTNKNRQKCKLQTKDKAACPDKFL